MAAVFPFRVVVSRGTSRDMILVEAEFDEPAPARDAVLALEGTGVDADDIHVVTPDTVVTPAGERAATSAIHTSWVRNVLSLGVPVALAGAVIVAVAVLALGVEPRGAAVLGGAIAGAVGGSILGGFWGNARKLPVNEEVMDTYAVDPRGAEPTRLEVRARDDATAEKVAAVLRAVQPRPRRIDLREP
jgi:hypothetical protein